MKMHIKTFTIKTSKNTNTIKLKQTTRCLKKVPLLTCYNIDIHWFDYDNFWYKCYRESRQSKCTLFFHLT